jgi:hypothetical protein
VSVRANTDDLGRKAEALKTELDSMKNTDLVAQAASFKAPCSHPVAIDAKERLTQISLGPMLLHAWGVAEGERLGLSLEATKNAYLAVDQASKEAIDQNTPITVMTQPVPPSPVDRSKIQPPAPLGLLRPAPFAVAPEPPDRQKMLEDDDQGQSLKNSAEDWRKISGRIKATAPAFETRNLDWEGLAAEAAYGKFNEYRGWLDKLASGWESLAAEAEKLVSVHVGIRDSHKEIADEYAQIKEFVKNNPFDQMYLQRLGRLQELQQLSDDKIKEYARNMSSNWIPIDEPPDSGLTPTAANRDPNAAPAPGDEPSPATNPGNPPGGGPGQGGPPAGGQPPMGEPAVSPASADPTAGKQPQGGSPAVGGSPGGGSPSGGGSPAGGGAPSGTPGGLPGGKPDLPKIAEPSLKPAGAGGGGSAGGGGGGMPSAPLGPAVAAETVAASPSGARSGGAPVGAAPAGAAAGGMGGGIGGMGHGGGQGQGQGKEKRRNPNLTPDEDLYVEDRAYTDPVIGHRPRRAKKAEEKDAT